MPLESIIKRIIAEANSKKEELIARANRERADIIEEAEREARVISENYVRKEKIAYENHKQKEIVGARLAGRKKILSAKREAMDDIFRGLKQDISQAKLKTEEVYHDKIKEASANMDFYLERLKLDYETQIAKILFE